MRASLQTAICGLGIAQIISWGSLYYAIAVLGDSIERDLGVGTTLLFAAFTFSLLISGCAAPAVGRLMEAYGARAVLCAGSVMGTGALFMLASATGPVSLFLGTTAAGIAMAACLYDAGFMALNQIAGDAYRKSVTGLTLFGGFASTVSWPASQFLLGAIGWRHTLACYAALQLLVCLPLHALVLPSGGRAGKSSIPDDPVSTALPDTAWLAAAFALGSFVLSVLSVHLIGVFRSAGMAADEAVFVASLVGPMQVLGRLLEFGVGRKLAAVSVGTVAFVCMIMALAAVFLLDGPSPLAFLVAALYGISNGLMTIVRGVVPAELYGRQHYAALLGHMARPAFIARALAPFAFPAALASLGRSAALLALAAIAVLACCTYQAAIGKARRI
jgi:MFS family permease